MSEGKILALLGALAMALFLFCGGAPTERDDASIGAKRPAMAASAQARDATGQAPLVEPASSTLDETGTLAPSEAERALAMTISAPTMIKNETAYPIDPTHTAQAGTSIRLAAEGPQILIIHTHSSEAYLPAGLDRYEPSDTTRTEDAEHNIIRVGDELTRLLEKAGLHVIHDRGVYDYPSYTGSYGRSGAAVERYLRDYPSIGVVLDVHRDALGSGDVIYKTVAEEEGTCASQIMLLVGTDESGLEHPNWRENLSFALYLQDAVSSAYPTLMRPVAVVPQRYNQHLCTGMLIVEVGSSGNTMQEALAAIRLFAAAAAPALTALVG